MPLQPEQIRERNSKPVVPGKIGLYWMQAAQRAHWNHALEHAIGLANAHGLPLVVLFCLVDDFPEANLRHYRFMLEGLTETRKDLEKKGIKLVVRLGQPEYLVPEMAGKAAWVVTDAGHLSKLIAAGQAKYGAPFHAGWAAGFTQYFRLDPIQ